VVVTKISDFFNLAVFLADHARALVSEAKGVSEAKATDRHKVNFRSDGTYVSYLNRDIERALRVKIKEKFPTHGIVGEEGNFDKGSSPYCWIIDPIDGTEEFINGIPLFGSVIALEEHGEPIVGVIDLPQIDLRVAGYKGGGTYCNNEQVILSEGEGIPNSKVRIGISKKLNFIRNGTEAKLFDIITTAYPNIRVYDSCFAYVATISGRLDVMVDYNVKHWDLAPCKLLCNEAGGGFEWVKRLTTPNGLTVYGAVFGKKKLVSNIKDEFF
jgi:fructose-1,6-bisphosphatase/inositol monophosphatase family enzyme